MFNLKYRVKLEKAEEGGFVVTFPDVPEAITQGDDLREALANATSALETALEMYMEAGEDLPRPSANSKTRAGTYMVSPPALATIKFEIYQTMRDDHVRKSELARRLGWHMPQIDRLLDLKHSTRLDHAEAALGALGRVLTMEFQSMDAPVGRSRAVGATQGAGQVIRSAKGSKGKPLRKAHRDHVA